MSATLDRRPAPRRAVARSRDRAAVPVEPGRRGRRRGLPRCSTSSSGWCATSRPRRARIPSEAVPLGHRPYPGVVRRDQRAGFARRRGRRSRACGVAPRRRDGAERAAALRDSHAAARVRGSFAFGIFLPVHWADESREGTERLRCAVVRACAVLSRAAGRAEHDPHSDARCARAARCEARGAAGRDGGGWSTTMPCRACRSPASSGRPLWWAARSGKPSPATSSRSRSPTNRASAVAGQHQALRDVRRRRISSATRPQAWARTEVERGSGVPGRYQCRPGRCLARHAPRIRTPQGGETGRRNRPHAGDGRLEHLQQARTSRATGTEPPYCSSASATSRLPFTRMALTM